MREKNIEKAVARRVFELGGIALKFVSPGTNGIPDRIALLPGGRVIFIEAKAPGEKPRPLQLYRMKQLQALGFECLVIDSQEAAIRITAEEKPDES